MIKKQLRCASLGLLSFWMQSPFAGTMGETESSPFAYVVSLGLGPLWSTGSDPQTLQLTPTIVKHYTGNESDSAFIGGEIFLGVQKNIGNSLAGQIGLAVATTGDEKYSGDIWDDGDPAFNNFTYRYKVQHTALRVKGKLISENKVWGVSPWVSAGLGIAWNTAKDFTSTPTLFQALPTPNFGDHTQTSFTYNLGAGIQRELTSHWVAGVGYDFADWGKFALGRANGQTQGTGLNQSNTYTNGVMFSLTYVS